MSKDTLPCPIRVICLVDASGGGFGFDGWPVYQCTIDRAGIAEEPSVGKTNGNEAPLARTR